ncbi:DNA-3-methyladenine glycosylase family protein [Lysinibacillus cavernae]|uniref:DNA-3-methyladenine glycosylase family protein n=1 Tax=Lysinibacillus cavernae TaxID=2666135 RepID=UPI0012D900B5|nr:DNA-3-methyladenine glycosylase [Lysinibacillus cavernae]
MKKIKFDLESNELKVLKEVDPQLAKLILLIGENSLDLKEDRFSALVRSIIGQQLSVKAASTISSRFFNIVNNQVNPFTIENINDETLREVGISKQKVSYIRDLCLKVQSQEVNLLILDNLPDTEVIQILTKVKGIGLWTAEMFLIFSLGRKNILSLGDVGLQRASRWLYGNKNINDNKLVLKEKGEYWKPYCSIASLYLWDAIDYGFVDNYENIDEVLKAMNVKL